MRIVALSDTHGQHRYINPPDGDVLVCAGDITRNGELSTMKDFATWMKAQPHQYKAAIFGNHDRFDRPGTTRDKAIEFLTDAGITYLEDSEVVIDGVKIWGSPYTPRFFDWAFNVDRGNAIAAKWAQISSDVDILITHGPPHLILDAVPKGIWFDQTIMEYVGCRDLLNRIQELKQLKAHCFGHIHNSSGVKVMNGITYANCAILDERYQIANPVRVIDI